MRGDVSIGDVIRAWRMLGATTDAERRAIASTLGFTLHEATDATLTIAAPPRAPAAPPPESITKPPPTPAAPMQEQEARPLELVPFKDVIDEPPGLPARGIERPVAAPGRQPLDPLFTAAWSRSISATLTARLAPVGAIDLDRTIDLLVHRLPIRRLPRRPRMVSAREIIVVIDRKGTLAWFHADADQLVRQLDAVTRTPVTVVEGEGVPILADPARTSDTDEDIFAIRPTTSGRVIALTDLGLSCWSPARRTPRSDAWLELAQALRARDTRLTIVSPTPLPRIPAPLRQLAICVHWDATMRPGMIHRQVKRQR